MKNDEKINAWIKMQLKTQKEPSFQQFMVKLLPGIDNILGIRLPTLRKIAKQLAKGKWQDYLLLALDDSYEEIMLQGLVLGYAQGNLLAKEEPEAFWNFLQEYLHSNREYEVRFALVQMLDYYINEAYLAHVLESIDHVNLKAYYVQMAQAWAVSICYREFPQQTMPYIKENHLDDFTHNKAIQKIMESLKVPKKEKLSLKTLKRI